MGVISMSFKSGLCVFAFGAVFTASGCVSDYGFSVPAKVVSAISNPVPSSSPSPDPGGANLANDKFNIPAVSAPKVDILFCVDNSLSMSDNQQILSDSFSGFISKFITSGVDFHIGLITSDVKSDSTTYWQKHLPGYPDANRGRLLSRTSERFITNQTADLVNHFQSDALVGEQGASNEQCLNSFIYATAPDMVSSSGWNKDFFRKDSLLSFIVVSDEDEDIEDGETVDARVQRLKDNVGLLLGASSRGSRYDLIIDKASTPTHPQPKPNYLPYPGNYYSAAPLLSAMTYNIAENFSSDLLTISQGIIDQAQKEFTLSHVPVAGTLVVKLNGAVVAANSTNGYVYHADRNTIELVGSTLGMSPGKSLSADYSY